METKMTKETAHFLYTALVRARKFDEKIVELYPEQEMKCPVHLSIGQEAAASAIAATLEKGDTVWSTHRCHAHTVAKGADMKKLFAELYGRVTGSSRGKGGSMHFADVDVGAMGSSAIVGGSLPLALGAALASQLQGQDRVSVAFFGDGAIEQGTFHEGMNFASLRKLPMIFMCENNGLATVTTLPVRQANKDLWKHAEQYNMPGIRVDGTKPQEVYEAALEAVARARRGEGPTLIEAVCFRWREHVGPKTDFHLGFRSEAEVKEQMEKDPVRLFGEYAMEQKVLTKDELATIDAQVTQDIVDAVAFARSSPYPAVEELYLHV